VIRHTRATGPGSRARTREIGYAIAMSDMDLILDELADKAIARLRDAGTDPCEVYTACGMVIAYRNAAAYAEASWLLHSGLTRRGRDLWLEELEADDSAPRELPRVRE
jgi:hypothetical protein